MKFKTFTFGMSCALTMNLMGCRQNQVSDELVKKAVIREIFELPGENGASKAAPNNTGMVRYYHIDSIEKKSQTDSDLSKESQGVLKATGRTIHTTIKLSLISDCVSTRYHERFQLPICDLGSSIGSSKSTQVPAYTKGHVFTIDNLDVKFVKKADDETAQWEIF